MAEALVTWPKLYIVLLTYARTAYATETLRSTLDGIRYSGQVSVHIADDGSPPEHREALVDLAGGYPWVHGITVTDAQRSGYGANWNLATQVVHNHADIVMPIEDDWVLSSPLDLDPLVQDLTNDARIECIRLGNLGWTQDLRGDFYTRGDRAYVVLKADSPERHIFAGHPRLETVDWERKVGPWPEGLGPNATEFELAGQRRTRQHVAFLLRYGTQAGAWYGHIGAIRSTDDNPQRVNHGS